MRFVLTTALAAALLPVSAAASTSTAHVVPRLQLAGHGHRDGLPLARARGRDGLVQEHCGAATVIATARGALRVVFKRFTFTYCELYTIRAKGNRGSKAFVKVIPECPSQSPGD